MTEIESAAKTALTRCMGLKNGESCLIITDKKRINLGEIFYNQAKLITENVKLIEIPELKNNGDEPPQETADEMLNYSVIMIPTTRSMSHTNARRKAIENGARLASMPGLTEEMAIRCLNADYNKIQERTKKLVDLHNKAKTIRILTKLGTDITMDIEGLECHGADGGIFTRSGTWGNLPGGESNMAPREGTTNGIFIVDKSMAGVGKLNNPIKITVKDGFAVSIEGKEEAEKLKQILQKIDDKKAYNIAEIGIGTNEKAIISGNILEDEKVMGTAHIALGNNMSYDGGTTDVPIHLDGIMGEPTIIIDDQKVMENGNFLI